MPFSAIDATPRVRLVPQPVASLFDLARITDPRVAAGDGAATCAIAIVETFHDILFPRVGGTNAVQPLRASWRNEPNSASSRDLAERTQFSLFPELAERTQFSRFEETGFHTPGHTIRRFP